MFGAAGVDCRADLYGLGKTFAAAVQNREPMHVELAKLPSPWKAICERLAAHDVGDRPATAIIALDEALQLLAIAKVKVTDLAYHAQEHRWPGPAPIGAGFAQMLESQMTHHTITLSTMTALASADDSWLLKVSDRDALFELLEGSVAIAEHDARTVSFDDADPVGTIYCSLYPFLSVQNRILCFKRLVRTSLALHRYHVMAKTRAAYSKETDPAVQTKLVAIIDAEDPGKVIEGRGVIPGR
jgi:hypothetical protein